MEPGGYCPVRARLNSGREGSDWQIGEVGLGDPAHEHLGIESRGTDQRQDLAVIGVQRDDGSLATGQGSIRGTLQVRVDGEGDVGTRLRWRHRKFADDPPLGIDLHLAVARTAVQQVLVVALHADLADMRAAGIGARIDPRQVLLVDPADITNHMGELVAERIEAHRARLDLHPRQLVPRDRNPGHRGVVEP